jgi:hypothetical protein
MIIRPYGWEIGYYHVRHPKQLVRLFGVLKLGLQNGCDKTRIFMMSGNEIIMTTLSEMNNPINVSQNTSKTIPKIGRTIDFTIKKNNISKPVLGKNYATAMRLQKELFT